MYGEPSDGLSQLGKGRSFQPDQHREGAAHAQNTPGGLSTQVHTPEIIIQEIRCQKQLILHSSRDQQQILFCVSGRFAYHLRQWQIEGTGISSHLKALSDKQSLPLRIVCQPAGLPDKVLSNCQLQAERRHFFSLLY